MKEKALPLGKFGAVAMWVARGALSPYFDLLKIFVLEHHVTIRKPTMLRIGIITFNSTYLTKNYLHYQYIEVFKYRKFSGSSFKHQIQHPISSKPNRSSSN